MSDTAIATRIGFWFVSRFRIRLKEVMKYREPDDPSAHYTVAKQLRKMGVPFETALFILNR